MLRCCTITLPATGIRTDIQAIVTPAKYFSLYHDQIQFLSFLNNIKFILRLFILISAPTLNHCPPKMQYEQFTSLKRPHYENFLMFVIFCVLAAHWPPIIIVNISVIWSFCQIIFFLLHSNTRQNRAERSLLLHTGRVSLFGFTGISIMLLFATECPINTVSRYESQKM